MEALIEQACELRLDRVMNRLPPLAFEGPRAERVDAFVVRTTHGYELTANVRRRDRIASLRALLSFAHSDELRRHERLSVAAARRTLTDSLHAILARGSQRSKQETSP